MDRKFIDRKIVEYTGRMMERGKYRRMTATYRSNNIAADIKRIIPARIAAERYGFTPSRAGYICCPFHMEKTGSLKFFTDGGWHCFGCGKGGSSIDFVMELFDIDFRQAVVRLDMDFSLNLICEKPVRAAPSAILEQRRRQQLRRRELETEIQNLCREHRRLHENQRDYIPDSLDFYPLYVEAAKHLPEVQYRLEELENELEKLTNGKAAN